MWSSLKHIGRTHRKKLAWTFSIVAVENLLFLAYPVFGSFAVNAVIAGNAWQALLYALVVLVMWLIGALRRRVDTQTFARIYSQMVVPIIANQRELEREQTNHQTKATSKIAARVALSREFVDFFEMHLPMAITSLVSLVGACVMLIFLEFWVGVLSLVILLFFAVQLPKFSRMSERLYQTLNNRLEADVHLIENAPLPALHKHYDFVARLRIMISNREAAGYLFVGVAMAVLFGFAMVWLTKNGYGSAGHIYAITTYLWMFAMSLDDVPRLVETWSNLNDVAKRVAVG